MKELLSITQERSKKTRGRGKFPKRESDQERLARGTGRLGRKGRDGAINHWDRPTPRPRCKRVAFETTGIPPRNVNLCAWGEKGKSLKGLWSSSGKKAT